MKKLAMIVALLCLAGCTSAPDLCSGKDAQQAHPFSCGPHG